MIFSLMLSLLRLVLCWQAWEMAVEHEYDFDMMPTTSEEIPVHGVHGETVSSRGYIIKILAHHVHWHQWGLQARGRDVSLVVHTGLLRFMGGPQGQRVWRTKPTPSPENPMANPGASYSMQYVVLASGNVL